MKGLGYLTGGNNGDSTAVSGDGLVIVGWCNSNASSSEAYRWTAATGMLGLGFLGGDNRSHAEATSADGSIVVGFSQTGEAGASRAFRWSATEGMRDIRDILINDFGLANQLAGWSLDKADACSADGRVIVGHGTNPLGQNEAWVARLEANPVVTGFVVNQGDPQRSRLTRIDVNFAEPIQASTLASLSAIKLTRTLASPTGAVGSVVQVGASGPNGRIIVSPGSGFTTSVTLTFDNANAAPTTAGIEYVSLADGRWQLSIPSAGYSSGLNDLVLRRFFGDGDANGTVDGSDFAHFGTVFGGPSVAFDYDINGIIDGIDFAAFGARFGITL